MNNPWKGLAFYEESDLELYKFCGRDKSIRELSAQIKNNLFITLYGRTGIGKTSLLRAGVFPLLRADRYVPIIVRFNNLDSDDPLPFAEHIIRRIEETIPVIKVNEYTKATDSEKDLLWEYFATRHFYDAEGMEVFPSVVLDQFEENFLNSGQKQKAWFLMEQLYSLVDDNKAFPEGYHNETNFRVVVSIREDDLFRLEDCIDTLSLSEFKYNRYRLVQLTDAEAEDIICIPGREVLPAEDDERQGIVKGIISLVRNGNDTDNNMSTLMLSLVCSRLYEKAQDNGGIISSSLVESMGSNLLHEFYESVICSLGCEEERYYIEDNLVDAHGRRNSINKEIIAENCPTWNVLTQGANRILQESNGKVELVHDMLAAAVYEAREKRREAERLAELEREKEEMRRKNRRRMMGMALALLFLLGVGGMFAYQYKQIRQQRNDLSQSMLQMCENQARATAEKAEKYADQRDYYIAALAALETLPEDLENPDDKAYTVEAESILRRALSKNHGINRIFGHKDHVSSVAFSPDGKKIVSGSLDNTIRIWDVETGDPIGEPLAGHTDRVMSVAFSPDGKKIVSGSTDKTIRIWNAETGKQIGESLAGHKNNINSVAFSPDGNKIVSGSTDKTIRIWDAETGKQIGESVGHKSNINSVAFSPDGSRIVSGSSDGTIRIWDVETGKQIGSPLAGHTSYVTSVIFSPDGKKIVSGSSDKTIKIWDAKSRKQIGEPFEGHTEAVESVNVSPDGERIVSASDDKTIRIWDVETGKQIIEPLVGHADAVMSIAFSPDGKRIVSGSWDDTIRIWDMEVGMKIGEDKIFIGSNSSFDCSPDGEKEVAGLYDGTIRIWNAKTGEQIEGPLVGHTGYVTAVAFSQDSKRIVSGSRDKTIRIWDVETGKQIGNPLAGHTQTVKSVAFSPDGKKIVSGSTDKTIRIWDVETGKQIGKPLVGHTENVHSVAFSPDGKKIVSGSTDKTIRIWDVETGKQIVKPLEGHTFIVKSVAFSPDGKRIVSGSWDDTIRIWDVETGKQIGVPLIGHTDAVMSIAFSPDGKRIVSVSEDKTIRIWDVESHKQIGEPLFTDQAFNTVSFSADGRKIISASENGQVRSWEWTPLQELMDNARKRLKGKLTPTERLQFYLD